jgi:hypothetical protein
MIRRAFAAMPPYDPSNDKYDLVSFNVLDVMKSTETYFDAYYRGAVRFFKTEDYPAFIYIAPRGFVYFIKTVLRAARGEFVTVRFECLKEQFAVSIHFSGMDQIIDEGKRIMKLSGMNVLIICIWRIHFPMLIELY